MEQARYFVTSFATLEDCNELEKAIQERQKRLTTKIDLKKIKESIKKDRNFFWADWTWQGKTIEPINRRYWEDFENLLKEWVPNFELMTEEETVQAFEQAYRDATGRLLATKEIQMN